MGGAIRTPANVAPDHAVAELSTKRPRLRSDLKFTFHESDGRPGYILEDLASRKYFHVGLVEFRFLGNFDGTRTVKEVVASSAGRLGKDALEEHQIQTMLRWAIDNELLETEGREQHSRRLSHASEQKKKKPKKFIQEALFLKIPLGNPDPFLNKISPLLSWTLSPLAVVLWLLVLIAGGFEALSNWRDLSASAGGAILPSNWLFLLVSFTGLKLIHELWHGVAAKRFQAPVPEWGVRMLALITPLTYVDASATWRFSSRWPRIVVAAAGMYVELFIAAIAVFVWTNTGPGFVNTLAYNIIFAASVVTVLFNANPLMRFDGYYILSDWLQIPNLGSKGQRFVKWAGKRFFFGMKDEILPLAIRERIRVISVYGVLAMIWKAIIWVGIMALASSLFKGAGIVIVAAVIAAAVFSGIKRSLKFLFKDSRGSSSNLWLSLARAVALIITIPALLAFIPISPSPKIYSVIRYPDKEILRVEAPGFASEVHCKNGERVEKGQLLLTLENQVKVLERESLELEVKKSEIEARRLLQDEMISSFQAEKENLTSLRKRLEVLDREVESLSFRAPISGRLVSESIASFKGSYLSPGQLVATILPEASPEIMLCIHQDDIEAIARRRTDEIELELRGIPGKQEAQLTRSEARATTEVPHPALTALAGGPLLLQQKPGADSSRERGLVIDQIGVEADRFNYGELGGDEEDRSLSQQELVIPHLIAYAALDEEAVDWPEGEWGISKLVGGQKYRLGEWLYDRVNQYVRAQFERARQGV